MGALQELHALAGQLLLAPAGDERWPDRVRALVQRLGELQDREPDGVLFLLLSQATRRMERYSSHHAIVCAAVARECASELQWPQVQVRSLVHAALTMNVSITALQDELVFRERTPTLDHRIAIDEHPAKSADALRSRGVTDDLWLSAVSQHHTDFSGLLIEAGLTEEQRLAHMLRRVDVLAAKISPRRGRAGLPPTMAVRDAYFSADGSPDEMGNALTKVLGIYPPGSLVTLDSAEIAIVLKRGSRPSRPIVAILAASNRQPYARAAMLDTTDGGSRVRGPAADADLRIPINPAQLLSLLPKSRVQQACGAGSG